MRRVVAAIVAVAVVGAVWLLVTRDDDVVPTGRLEAVEPFGAEAVLDASARSAVYAPDGARLAVVADGLLHVSAGETNRITASGTNVVDAAWFPAATAVLVAEGPGETGTLAVVERDGTVRGSVVLDPSVGFGSGHGMTLLTNERAVVTVVDRPGLGSEERRSLAVVELTTGAVRRLPPPEGEEEYGPHRVDDATVLVTGSTSAHLLDIETGKRTQVGPAGARAAGVIAEGETLVLVTGDDIIGVEGGADPHRLGRLPAGADLVAVAPDGAQAVIAVSARLRKLALTPPRIRPDTDTPG